MDNALRNIYREDEGRVQIIQEQESFKWTCSIYIEQPLALKAGAPKAAAAEEGNGEVDEDEVADRWAAAQGKAPAFFRTNTARSCLLI